MRLNLASWMVTTWDDGLTPSLTRPCRRRIVKFATLSMARAFNKTHLVPSEQCQRNQDDIHVD